MSFSYEDEINSYPAPDYWKAGLIFYINNNKLSIKSKKDLDKIINDFNNLKLGE